jgi:acyl-CoA thioesterase FadM
MTAHHAGGERSPRLHLLTEAEQTTSFVHTVTVRFGDCDPAAIAYTARIPAWCLEAIEAWWKHHAGFDWYELNIDRGLGTPFVHMRMDFRAPVTPRHPLVCEVIMKRLGHRSITLVVAGVQDGILCFEGEFVSVFVDAKAMKARTPPPDLVERIQQTTARRAAEPGGRPPQPPTA